MQRILASLSLLAIISMLSAIPTITSAMGDNLFFQPASVTTQQATTNTPNTHAVVATGNATTGKKTSTSTSTPMNTQPLLNFLHQHHHQFSTSIDLGNITFLSYVNPKFGIRIQYPSNWLKQENGTTSNTLTDVVTFLSPLANKSATQRANLDVTIDNISDERGISLADYVANTVKDLRSSYKDFKLLASTKFNTTSATTGHRAYELVYSLNDPHAGIVQVSEVGTIGETRAYILEYSTDQSKYSYYLPIIHHMIGSFGVQKP
jgi:hypothetical protein